MQYLTESRLLDELTMIFPESVWIHNKTVPLSNRKIRPDYRCEELKLIVEFDGYHHYNNSERIRKDSENTQIYQDLNYKVVRIPYFVQLTTETIEYYFNVFREVNQTYPQGFVDDKALLPSDFCYSGLVNFMKQFNDLPYMTQFIIYSSLMLRQRERHNTTIPEILLFLIDENKCRVIFSL